MVIDLVQVSTRNYIMDFVLHPKLIMNFDLAGHRFQWAVGVAIKFDGSMQLCKSEE